MNNFCEFAENLLILRPEVFAAVEDALLSESVAVGVGVYWTLAETVSIALFANTFGGAIGAGIASDWRVSGIDGAAFERVGAAGLR